MPRDSIPAFLSLGSNLGERLANLRAAVRALEAGPHLSVVAASKVYETEPVEVEEVEGAHPDYLNCVLELDCALPAMELLRYCQGVEAALGRERKGEMAPRTVDVDLLLYGDEEIETPDLVVPHRGVGRAFNLRSLADVAPGLFVPGLGGVMELLEESEGSGIREVGDPEILF